MASPTHPGVAEHVRAPPGPLPVPLPRHDRGQGPGRDGRLPPARAAADGLTSRAIPTPRRRPDRPPVVHSVPVTGSPHHPPRRLARPQHVVVVAVTGPLYLVVRGLTRRSRSDYISGPVALRPGSPSRATGRRRGEGPAGVGARAAGLGRASPDVRGSAWRTLYGVAAIGRRRGHGRGCRADPHRRPDGEGGDSPIPVRARGARDARTAGGHGRGLPLHGRERARPHLRAPLDHPGRPPLRRGRPGSCATRRISSESGKSVFEQTDVEVPTFWSQLATNVVVSKYFRGHIGTPQRENSVRQLIDRVVNTIAGWAATQHYFATDEDLADLQGRADAPAAAPEDGLQQPGLVQRRRRAAPAVLGLLHQLRRGLDVLDHGPRQDRGDALQVRLGRGRQPLAHPRLARRRCRAAASPAARSAS